MKKISLLTLLSTFLLAACSPVDSVQVFDQKQAAILLHQQYPMQTTQQMIKLSLPNKNHWKKVDMSLGTVGTPIMLIPENENMNNWTQSYRTQIRGLRHDAATDAHSLVRELIAKAKKRCTTTNAEILHEQAASTEYKLKITGCQNETDQVQIGKALNGQDAIYVVYYTAQIDSVKMKQIEQNTQVISAAKLVQSRLH